MHYPQHVFEPGMFSARIDKVAQAELAATVEALKSSRVEQAHLLWVEFDITMKIVSYDFHQHSSLPVTE